MRQADMNDQEQAIKPLAQIITFYRGADFDQIVRVGRQ